MYVYKGYYTSNHQNIDFVVIAINLHVLPEMPSRNLLFRICTVIIYCSEFALSLPSGADLSLSLGLATAPVLFAA